MYQTLPTVLITFFYLLCSLLIHNFKWTIFWYMVGCWLIELWIRERIKLQNSENLMAVHVTKKIMTKPFSTYLYSLSFLFWFQILSSFLTYFLLVSLNNNYSPPSPFVFPVLFCSSNCLPSFSESINAPLTYTSFYNWVLRLRSVYQRSTHKSY